MKNLFKIVDEMTNAVIASFDDYASAWSEANLLNKHSDETSYKVVC